jgi:hypothetical protein
VILNAEFAEPRDDLATDEFEIVEWIESHCTRFLHADARWLASSLLDCWKQHARCGANFDACEHFGPDRRLLAQVASALREVDQKSTTRDQALVHLSVLVLDGKERTKAWESLSHHRVPCLFAIHGRFTRPLVAVVGDSYVPLQIPEVDAGTDGWLRTLHQRGCDFVEGIASLVRSGANVGQIPPKDFHFLLIDVLYCLTKRGLFSFGVREAQQLIDWTEVRQCASRPPLHTAICSRGWIHFGDSRTAMLSPTFWMWLLGVDAIAPCVSAITESDDLELSESARGLVSYVESFISQSRGVVGPKAVARSETPWAKALEPLLGLIRERRERNRNEGQLAFAHWQAAILCCELDSGALDKAHRSSLGREATECLGRLRLAVRQAPNTGFSDAELTKEWNRGVRAAILLRRTLGGWQAAKALMLLLRSVAFPVVTIDLDYALGSTPERTDESFGRPHWQEGMKLPNQIALALGGSLQDELDPVQTELRTRFAEFCLQRLRSKSSHVEDEAARPEVNEPDPIWRYGYVRAIRELRVNPYGRGHRTLYWTMEHDPDEKVRFAAKEAYHEIRQNVALQEGRSPKASLFAAFWWLRQAHRLSLGLPVDGPAAQRTRAKELRRVLAESEVSSSSDGWRY